MEQATQLRSTALFRTEVIRGRGGTRRIELQWNQNTVLALCLRPLRHDPAPSASPSSK